MEARNQWQPVTEIYQQILDPSARVEDDPMILVNAARHARSQAEGKTPFGITAITGIYFLRAAVYALFAAKLLASADSTLGGWITVHCPSLIPLSLSTANTKTLPTTMAEAMGVMAVLSLGMGLLWLIRWKPILFISVAFAGYFMVHVALSYMHVAGLGDPNLFGAEQIDILVIDGAMNLLTFFFIILYPNLKNSFRRGF
jgi:hypothetical protein